MTQRELGLSALVKVIVNAWLANWQLGIDGPFQQVTGELGCGARGRGVAVTVLM